MKVKVLLVAEVEVQAHPHPVASALAKIDAFREAVQPSSEYGVTLSCATPEDVKLLTGRGPTWVLGLPVPESS
jgi:hypothetical protein